VCLLLGPRVLGLGLVVPPSGSSSGGAQLWDSIYCIILHAKMPSYKKMMAAILKPKDKPTKKDTITKVTGGGEFQKVVQI